MDFNIHSSCAIYDFASLGLSEVGILEQFNIQILASVAVAIWSGLASFAILIILKKIIGIMVSSEEEQAGLDRTSHSESAYN